MNLKHKSSSLASSQQSLHMANCYLLSSLDLTQHEANLPFSNIGEFSCSKVKLKKTYRKYIQRKSCGFFPTNQKIFQSENNQQRFVATSTQGSKLKKFQANSSSRVNIRILGEEPTKIFIPNLDYSPCSEFNILESNFGKQGKCLKRLEMDDLKGELDIKKQNVEEEEDQEGIGFVLLREKMLETKGGKKQLSRVNVQLEKIYQKENQKKREKCRKIFHKKTNSTSDKQREGKEEIDQVDFVHVVGDLESRNGKGRKGKKENQKSGTL